MGPVTGFRINADNSVIFFDADGNTTTLQFGAQSRQAMGHAMNIWPGMDGADNGTMEATEWASIANAIAAATAQTGLRSWGNAA
jgi:hypothetical protein